MQVAGDALSLLFLRVDQTFEHFAFSQDRLRLELTGQVSSDLCKADQFILVVKRNHHTAYIKSRTVLSQMPALVRGLALSSRRCPLFFRLAFCAVLGRENNV